MFGLRSSPSTFVPCSIRGAVAGEAGMGFGVAARVLTAPRPKRVVMPIVYYDGAPGAYACSPYTGGNATGGGATSAANSSVASSDYAGVFESGCDPAQVRASLTSRTPVATLPREEESGTVSGWPDSVCAVGTATEDDPSDCLFPMDGPDAGVRDVVPDTRGMMYNGGGLAGPGSGMSVAVGRATAAATAATASGGSVSGGARAGTPKRGASMASVAAGATPPTQRSDKVMLKTTYLRRATPRAIAPGRRCVAPGMYRLRLSTSC